MARLQKKMHKAFNDEVIRELRIANINTVADFLHQDTGRLEKIIHQDHKVVKEIQAQMIETFSGKIESGRELLEFEETNIISTGIQSLDQLLNGGLHPGDVYEICGLSSSGKTELCLNLAINVVLETDGVVRYIDTKKDFSVARVQMILDAKNHDDEKIARVMDQIRITRVTNINELMSVLYDLTRSLKTRENDEKSTKLVIIDSLPSLILSSSTKSDGFSFLNHIAGVIKFLSNTYHISVITNNLVTQWRENEGFDAAIIRKPLIVKPTLGKFWYGVPNTRLHVEKLTDENRKISVWKSSRLKIGSSCLLNLTDVGFT